MSETAWQPVILIPSLEPDDRLPAYVERLRENGFPRVVVVDDGSGPKYRPIFDRIAALEGCAVLRHEVNRGKGAGLRTGYQYIREQMPDADAVITADADGQHTVEDVRKVSEALRAGGDALYLGSRDFSLPNVPPKSRSGNRITSAVFKLLYGVWLPDTQTGLRAFRREELAFMEGIEGDRYEYEMNVLIACARRRLPMIPVTIETVYENDNEGSHFHPIRDSWRIYKVILGGFFRFMSASIVCFLLDQGLAAVLREWLLPLMGVTDVGAIWVSGLAARLVSAVVNFALNKNLVFRLKGDTKGSAVRYAVLCVAIICLSNAGVWLLSRLGVASWLAKMVCDFLLYFLSYRVQQSWVFAESGKKEA